MQFTPKKSFDSLPTRSPLSANSKAPHSSAGSRFIPNRLASNLSSVFEKAAEITQTSETENSAYYSALLQSEIFGLDSGDGHARNLLRYKPTPPIFEDKENMPFAPHKIANELPELTTRKVNKAPYKVLDAPQLADDFYLNLLDWSSNDNLVVGLNTSVYLWSAASAAVTKLCGYRTDQVTSVNWAADGNYLAVGCNSGVVQVYDVHVGRVVRKMEGHTARVGSIAWNNWLISTGSRDRSVLHRDLRAPDNFSAKLSGHKQEVCGLKWSPDGTQLASGGNDNKLILWSSETTQPIAKFSEHKAAVKALAWSPHQRGLLVSGGGTADRTIRFWDTQTSSHVKCIDTNSQVCSLMFSKTCNELVSTHGYSQNQVVVWKYPSLQKVAVLLGHTSRVLYLAMSADGENIVTGAGDETLRFWKAFPKSAILGGEGPSSLMPSFAELR
jgi:cell division cycle 20-like protein 1 (cofactor of APC complex)